MPSDPTGDPFSRRADDLFEQLAAETEQLVDPLPAHRVRQLGDRRRARRRAGVTAGALAVAAIAGVSALDLSRSRAPHTADPAAPATSPAPVRPSIAASSPAQVPVVTVTTTITPTASDDPSSTSSSEASPASAAASTTPGGTAVATPGGTSATPSTNTSTAPLTEADVAGTSEFARGGSSDMYGSASMEPESGTPQSAVSLCEKDRTGLGQTAVLHRVATGSGIITEALAYQFDSVEKATAARGTVREWYAGCLQQLQANGYTATSMTPAVDAPVGSHAKAFGTTQATFRLVRATAADGTPVFEEASLYQVGNRLEWVVTTLTGAQDDSFDTAPGGPVGTLFPGIEHSARITNMLAPGN